ncbi:GTP 3',8-cyclase MoaA [bacterium]|nr:GTP 3',8-cyclase MoaA [bacterium]MCG2675702.1 GTP 3',8-cyclase MoaA [bacterium]
MKGLIDRYNRKISYLRVSVTDRCNLRCIYCMPPEGIKPLRHEDILRFEEIKRIVRYGIDWGIDKVRITGGEPLVRKKVVYLIEALSNLEGIRDLSMTTNGILLKDYAEDLKNAGLQRINVSLDSLDANKFNRITKVRKLSLVLDGIEEALKRGLEPVKINVVVMKGINDDEVLDFAKMSLDRPLHIRFIEFMPFCKTRIYTNCKAKKEATKTRINPVRSKTSKTSASDEYRRTSNGVNTNKEGAHPFEFVSTSIIRERLKELGELIPAQVRGAGPAKPFRFEKSLGTVGFITPMSEHFCATCNRLRLTADGRLYPCLFSDYGVDIKTPLRTGADYKEIRELFEDALKNKPEKHFVKGNNQVMSKIGG